MSSPKFSTRTDWVMHTNKITEVSQALKNEKAPVLDLTVSNPTECGFEYPQEILAALQDPQNLSYEPEAAGMLAAREAVSEYYQRRGFSVDPERIFLCSSTSEAYSYLFRLLADFGDHILFPRPSYPLFSFLGDINDITLDHYRLMPEERWRIDLSDLAEHIEPETRAIVLVNPNNPTGSYIWKHELEELNKIATAYGLALISDEVFWDYTLEAEEKPASLVNNHKVLSFTLGGLSKTLALPQMKLSWIVINGPEDQVDEARKRLEVIADTFLSVNTPVQRALPAWLKHADALQDQVKERIRSNYAFLKEQTRTLKTCDLLGAQGGWYAILKLSTTAKSEEEWVIKLLSKYHLFVHPGFFFDFEAEPFLVLSLLTKSDIFQEGALRLLSRIEQEES